MDKLIINVTKDGVAGAQVATVLTTTTFPCTVVGLRWKINHFQDAGTSTCALHWAIIHVRQGHSPNTLALSDASTLYAPEQDVMTWGVSVVDNNVQTVSHEGSSKTGRKLLGGDTLQFIAIGVATNTSGIRGSVQFFCKT